MQALQTSATSFSGWFRLALAEHAFKDLVHIAQLPLQAEGTVELLRRNALRYSFVFRHQLAEIHALFPCAHRVPLDESISVLPRHPAFGKVQQQLAAKD